MAGTLLLGCAFDVIGAVVLLGWVLTLGCNMRRRGRRAVLSFLTCLGVLLLLLIPALILKKTQHNYQIHQFGFPVLKGIGVLSRLVMGDYTLWGIRGEIPKILGCLLLGGILWGTWQELQTRRQNDKDTFPWMGILSTWLFLPWVAMIIAEGLGTKSTLSHLRYLSPALPSLALIWTLAILHWQQHPFFAATWRRRLCYGIGIVILLLPTGAWYVLEWGDGPHTLVKKMRGKSELFVGNVLPLKYEFRHASPGAIQLVDWGMKHPCPIEEARLALVNLASNHETCWLIVYESRKTPLDSLAKSPPAPWVAERQIHYEDARAVLLKNMRNTVQP
jgi:hypothetical protein